MSVLLACHYTDMPPAWSISDKVHDSKECALTEKYIVQHIVENPTEPSGLPTLVFLYAYEGCEPDPRTFPGENLTPKKNLAVFWGQVLSFFNFCVFFVFSGPGAFKRGRGRV